MRGRNANAMCIYKHVANVNTVAMFEMPHSVVFKRVAAVSGGTVFASNLML